MKRSLKSKLILSYLAIALLTVLVVTVVIQLTSGQFMMNLVVDEQTAMLQESVQSYYTSNGTLQGFFEYYLQSQSIRQPAPSQPDGPDNKPPQNQDIRGVHGLVDTQYRALIPTINYEIGQTVPTDMLNNAVAVKVDGETIAWILPDTKFEFQLNSEEQLFLQRTRLAVSFAALAGVIAAVAMGIFLASALLKPIRNLSHASQAMAQGNLDQQVPVTSHDELGQLTSSFNQMCADLLHADQQRKRMTADITHDLGTPLQIISGYVEMMEDSEIPLTPQRIEIIKTEIGHLRRLVDDLGTLSQVEAGGLNIEFQPVNPVQIMEHIQQAYQPIAIHSGINIALEIPASCPEINVDESRMEQVIKNLVDNALRYTSKEGSITLAVRVTDLVELCVIDSGAGINQEDLPYVFDRFYQADKARGANVGKMGLGLAICKALVTAQGGSIHAESGGKGLGTSMVVRFEAIKQKF
jgi:signal transduction histidine kinase